MSIPPPVAMTPERGQLDATQRTITRALLAALGNLPAFDEFLATIPSNPEALTQEPYSYTVDEAYALRLFGQHAAAYAHLFEDGGTLSAGDATTLSSLTRRGAGAISFVSQGV